MAIELLLHSLLSGWTRENEAIQTFAGPSP